MVAMPTQPASAVSVVPPPVGTVPPKAPATIPATSKATSIASVVSSKGPVQSAAPSGKAAATTTGTGQAAASTTAAANQSGGGMSTKQIALLAGGIGLAVLFIAVGIYIVYRKKRKNKQAIPDDATDHNHTSTDPMAHSGQQHAVTQNGISGNSYDTNSGGGSLFGASYQPDVRVDPYGRKVSEGNPSVGPHTSQGQGLSTHNPLDRGYNPSNGGYT